MNPDPLGERLPSLSGQNVLLRSLTDADANAILALFGDADVVRFMSLEQLESGSDARTLISSIQSDFDSGRLYQWGIVVENALAGTCTLFSIDRQHRRAELGFAVLKRLWGRGIASRAVPAVLEFGFERLGLHRIEAEVDPENRASIRLLEQMGFAREGRLRGRYLEAGEPRDSLYYGLLRSEWRAEALRTRADKAHAR